MSDLPSYLQTRATKAVATRAAEGIGGSLPPHISIRGNRFTLVDAAGNKKQVDELFLDGCFVDVSDVMCKQFYENPDWTPDSNDPPTCWSANGIAPSRDASTPQAATCAVCDWNVRGSAHSKVSGKAVKACRDEKWAAFAPAKFPGMLFQLKVTPGSFKAWSAYVKKFEGQSTDLSDVVTRVTFAPDTNGQLLFEATSYIDEATYKVREAALVGKNTDVLVGRNDVPRQGALGPLDPANFTQALPAPPLREVLGTAADVARQATLPLSGPAAGFSSESVSLQTGGPGATAAVSVEPAQKRTRRTKEQIAADNAAKAAGATQGQASPAAPIAPFRPAEAPAKADSSFGGQNGGSNFGIGGGVAPNAELQATINSVFGK